MKKAGTTAASAICILAVLLLGWVAILRSFHIQPYLVPSPEAVVDAVISRFASLRTSFLITSCAAAGGLAASVVVGVTIALIFAQSPWIRRMFYPYTILLQTVPIVAIAPLLLMWIGPGISSVMLVAFIICLPPIIANTTQGLISVDRNMIELFLMSNASPLQILFKLRLPHALPFLLTGVRIASGIAVIGAITGELFAGSSRVGVGGIGYALQYANAQLQTDYLFALIAAATLLGFSFFFLVAALEWYFLHHWHESSRTLGRE